MEEATYHGIKFLFDFCSYKIFLPTTPCLSFQAYAGNKVFNIEEKEAEKIIKNKAKYNIRRFEGGYI